MIGGQLARRYGVPYRSSNVSRRQRRRRAGGLRVGLLAVGRDHGRGQPADARRRLDGGRPPRQLREDDPRRRAARDGRRLPRAGRRRRGQRWPSTRCGRSGRAATSSARSTPSRATGPRSTSRCSRDWRNYETWQEAGSPEAAGKANRIWKELLAAYEPPPMDPAIREELDGIRRPPRRRGRRPDRLLNRPSPSVGGCLMKSSAQVVVIGGGVVGCQRAVSPDQGGLDRRRAARAARADGRLDLARGGRDAHAQRRPERLEAPAVHDQAVRGDRADLRTGLLDPPAGRADAGRHGGPDGLPADGRGSRPLPRDGPRADHPERGRRRSSRCSTRSTSSARCTTRSRATWTRPGSPAPTSRSRPAGRRRGPPAHTGRRPVASARTGRWDVRIESGDVIHAEHVVNAGGLWAREVGRMVGIELPVLAMEHIYLITQDMPEVADHVAASGREMPMALDFGGEIYIRQEGERDAARARTSRPACRGRRARRRGTSARSCSSPTSTGSRPSSRSRSATTRRWARPGSGGSSTGRSPSRPTAIRWSGRSAACAASGSPAR